MSPRLDIIEWTAQAQALRDDAESDFIAALALRALVQSMADQAQELRDAISDDEYVQLGLGQWDRDMGRLRQQLARVMEPTLNDPSGPHEADVIRPILEGVWPQWLRTLPQYKDGIAEGDPLLPPNSPQVDGGSFKTTPVVTTVASLWNQAFEAQEHDASAGNDAASRSIKEVITDVVTYFEERPAGEHTDDPDDATWWSDVRDWTANVGEMAGDTGSALWSAATGGFGTVLGWTAAGLLTLWVAKTIISR